MFEARECGCVSKHMGNERITDKRLENALKSRAGIISRDNRYIWQYISPQTLCLWVFLCRNAEKKTYGKPRRTRREGIANGLKRRKMDANEFTDRVFH